MQDPDIVLRLVACREYEAEGGSPTGLERGFLLETLSTLLSKEWPEFDVVFNRDLIYLKRNNLAK